MSGKAGYANHNWHYEKITYCGLRVIPCPGLGVPLPGVKCQSAPILWDQLLHTGVFFFKARSITANILSMFALHFTFFVSCHLADTLTQINFHMYHL